MTETELTRVHAHPAFGMLFIMPAAQVRFPDAASRRTCDLDPDQLRWLEKHRMHIFDARGWLLYHKAGAEGVLRGSEAGD